MPSASGLWPGVNELLFVTAQDSTVGLALAFAGDDTHVTHSSVWGQLSVVFPYRAKANAAQPFSLLLSLFCWAPGTTTLWCKYLFAGNQREFPQGLAHTFNQRDTGHTAKSTNWATQPESDHISLSGFGQWWVVWLASPVWCEGICLPLFASDTAPQPPAVSFLVTHPVLREVAPGHVKATKISQVGPSHPFCHLG